MKIGGKKWNKLKKDVAAITDNRDLAFETYTNICKKGESGEEINKLIVKAINALNGNDVKSHTDILRDYLMEQKDIDDTIKLIIRSMNEVEKLEES